MLSPLDLITAPVLGPIQMVQWLAQKLIEAAEMQMYDVDRLKGELLELQAQYDMGEVTDEEYIELEEALLKRMNDIRENRV